MMIAALLSALALVSNETSPTEGFCQRVADNHGCCPACKYTWDGDQCVTKEKAATPYCKLLTEPAHQGCCLACGHKWSATEGKCVNLITIEDAEAAPQAKASAMMPEESFCEKVADNSGCCPACGYVWSGDKCTTNEPATTPYCKELTEPKHGGCCVFCGNVWSAAEGKCVKA